MASVTVEKKKDWTISNQAPRTGEGSTIIPKGSRTKRSEARGLNGSVLLERFMNKVDKTTSTRSWNGTKCHEWQSAVAKNGYGQIHRNGKTAYAHRVAWELYNGFISVGKSVLHRWKYVQDDMICSALKDAAASGEQGASVPC